MAAKPEKITYSLSHFRRNGVRRLLVNGEPTGYYLYAEKVSFFRRHSPEQRNVWVQDILGTHTSKIGMSNRPTRRGTENRAFDKMQFKTVEIAKGVHKRVPYF